MIFLAHSEGLVELEEALRVTRSLVVNSRCQAFRGIFGFFSILESDMTDTDVARSDSRAASGDVVCTRGAHSES